MIKLEKTQVVGLETAIRGMRNPMNSWEKSDSVLDAGIYTTDLIIGMSDYNLMMSLAKSGTDHAKFRRMIVVYVDITAPLYWWKEFDTYKVGTVANSCSTMHKIADKEFTLLDFSDEHMLGIDMEEGRLCEVTNKDLCFKGDPDVAYNPMDALFITIGILNKARKLYLETGNKRYWWQMIQLLPSSYNQKRTVMLNYEVLANIYKSRKNHKLDEWRKLCDWIKDLPVSEVITLEGGSENDL